MRLYKDDTIILVYLEWTPGKVHCDKARNCFECSRSAPSTLITISSWSQQLKYEREEFAQIEKAGVPKPAVAEWALSTVFVSKKNGSLRFCVDYYRINAVTVQDSFCIPRIGKCIDSKGKARILVTLDTSLEYRQIKIDNNDANETAVVAHNRL